MITLTDIQTQVEQTLDGDAGFDARAIAEEIRDTYGLVDIESIEDGAYWAIVQKHAN